MFSSLTICSNELGDVIRRIAPGFVKWRFTERRRINAPSVSDCKYISADELARLEEVPGGDEMSRAGSDPGPVHVSSANGLLARLADHFYVRNFHVAMFSVALLHATVLRSIFRVFLHVVHRRV